MNIRDRFTRGFLAGLAAGIVMNIFSFISFALNWVEIRFLDWAGVLIFGRQPVGALEIAVSLAGQLFFTSLLGVFFAYLISMTTSRGYILKGLVYGLAVWFASYAISILFRVPTLVRFRLDTVTSNIVGALLFGLVLAVALKWLDEQVKV
ncbi:MAG: hypothetical protein ACOY9Y_07750 [Bacillota bacterium]